MCKGGGVPRSSGLRGDAGIGEGSHHCALLKAATNIAMRQRVALCSLLAAAAALQPAARKPTGGRLPTRALQPAAHKPAGARLPTRRHMSAEQTDPVLEVERLENAIAASTEPDEQKELAEKLGMSRMSAEMSVLSANAAFYDAFQSCDVAKMKAVWSCLLYTSPSPRD